nr:hypothetical protein [Tanacetum cinerariifolium]
MVGSPHRFIIHWIVILNNIKKVTEVIDVKNWRVDNSRVSKWIVSLVEWNSSVSSMKSSIQKLSAAKHKLMLLDTAAERRLLLLSQSQLLMVMKKRPQTEAQARRNMIMYLKNTAVLRLDYFKGMSYDDIRPIFEAKFNSNIKFLLKSKEQIEEEENRALESIHETPAQKAAKRIRLNEEVEELKQHLEIVPD